MIRNICTALIYLAGLFSIAACSEPTNSGARTPVTPTGGPDPAVMEPAKRFTYVVDNTFPHDTVAFTQGLAVLGDTLYESTGNYGRSTLREVVLQTGDVERIRSLSSTIFGEGLAIFDDKIIQLTWKSGVGFIYDRGTFDLIRSVAYPGEGWGIAYDGERFVMSDGSSTLYFRDKVTFAEIGRVIVRDEDGQVRYLNELEYVKGEIYANIWQEDRIARIDPASGWVTGWIDLEGLLEPEEARLRADVLNGIAYDALRDRLFVTGKWWPRLYEIRLVEE